jgi:hypothetical protein
MPAAVSTQLAYPALAERCEIMSCVVSFNRALGIIVLCKQVFKTGGLGLIELFHIVQDIVLT